MELNISDYLIYVKNLTAYQNRYTYSDFKDGNYRYITYTNIYNNPAINLSSNDFVHIKENEKPK